jgi:hypothetical protein
MFQIADLFTTDTPLSGPSWSSGRSDVGARTILNDPSVMNPESSARINQVCMFERTMV